MSRPVSPLTWTPGPTGKIIPPTVPELAAHLFFLEGAAGCTFETSKPVNGWPSRSVVCRDQQGQPIGILHLRYWNHKPELVNIAVLPEHQRHGVARSLAACAHEHGVDLRDIGAVWDGPLTDDAVALRDGLEAWAGETFGPASWERQGNHA